MRSVICSDTVRAPPDLFPVSYPQSICIKNLIINPFEMQTLLRACCQVHSPGLSFLGTWSLPLGMQTSRNMVPLPSGLHAMQEAHVSGSASTCKTKAYSKRETAHFYFGAHSWLRVPLLTGPPALRDPLPFAEMQLSQLQSLPCCSLQALL